LTNTNDLVGVTATSITFDSTAGAFAISGNAITLGGNISFNADPAAPVTHSINADLDLGGANRTITTQPNGNVVLGGVISGTNTVFKNNSGTLTLSGANNFTGGAVQVRAGTLKLGANEVLPGGITLNPIGVPATLDLNGKTETVSSLTFANSGGTEFVNDSLGGGLLKLDGNLFLNASAGPAVISANLELSTGTQQIGVFDATSTLTVSGAVSSASGITNLLKTGVGRLILAGPYSYQSDTIVRDGTLQLNTGSLSATNAIYLVETNGAELNLNFTGTNVVSALYTNDVALPDGVYNAGNLSGLITGGGALKIGAAPAAGPGNLVNVTVSGGSLIFSVTNSGGIYRIQANTNLANASGWVDVATNTAPFSFTNSVSALPRQFFRTVTP
jgi:autotransporter-associated beta strand protein